MANPRAPTMKGIPKIHKPNVPIRPLVNFRSAPTYNAAKLLSNVLSKDLNLQYRYNVKNSVDFVEKMKHVKFGEMSRLVSFDISNLYTNVPVKEVINIIKNMLEKEGLNKTYISQLICLLKSVLGQNYFRFNNKFYLQSEGLAMGSPLSAILSEVFLQYNEELFLAKLKKNHDISSYLRYVDDILVVFNEKGANEIDSMLSVLNSHHKNLSFTSEFEVLNQINFLDLTLTRNDNTLSYKIYRKPTQTDTTIQSTSVHPMSHKTASFRSMLYRVHSIPLSNKDRQTEINIIKKIAKANGYNPSIIDDIGNTVIRKIKNKQKINNRTTLKNDKDESDKKYVTFHFNGTETQRIANRFKKYNVSVAFKTNNTLGNIFHPNIENENKYNKSGVYRINCSDCNMSYIGQTVQFNKRYKNHISAWKNNKPERSNVAKHLLNNNHKLGTIEENMSIMKFCDKGKLMTAWEDLFIFKDKTKNRAALINEQVNFDSDIVYKNIFKKVKYANNNIQPG